jgi:hypothetical protein
LAHHEKRDSLDSDVDEEKTQSAEVVSDVQHRPLHVVRLDFLVLLSSTLQDESLSRYHALAFVEEPAVLGVRRHQEWRAETNENREKTLKEENVAPRFDDHGSDAPRGDASKAAHLLVYRRIFKIYRTHPVARRPPKAPAMEAAET